LLSELWIHQYGTVSRELIGLLQEVLGAARLIVGKFAAYAPRGKTAIETQITAADSLPFSCAQIKFRYVLTY
jgi:hypothetical protein